MKPQNTENKQKYTVNDAGCYFDSARGIYIGEAVIEFAQELGMVVSDEDQENTTPDGEYYHELWDKAENWIDNHTITPDGYYWGSNESGDWGLWGTEED